MRNPAFFILIIVKSEVFFYYLSPVPNISGIGRKAEN
jgi:hypothetical protein